MKTLHGRLQRFARNPLHRRYLAAAYAHSLGAARKSGADPLAGARPRVLLCGSGSAQTTVAFLDHLRRAHATVTPLVLDLSAEPLRASRAAGAAALFVRADASHLPLANGSVDLIESDFFLQYFPDAGKRRIVEEWARVLAPGGVITTRDYVPQPRSRIDSLLDRLRVFVLRFFLRQSFHSTSEADVVAAFRDYGLTVSFSRFRIGGRALPLVQSLTARHTRSSLR